jgi:hypothetical protein
MAKKIKPKSVVVITDLQEKSTFKKSSLAPGAINSKSDAFMVSVGLRQPKVDIDQEVFKSSKHKNQENSLEVSQELLTDFVPYFMGEKPSNLNITKFEAKDLFKFPA